MEERGFSEVELRVMLEQSLAIVGARQPGRWVVHTRFAGEPWIVIVEPDFDGRVLTVVTAYSRRAQA